MVNFKREIQVDNQQFRNTWIADKLQQIRQNIPDEGSLLDVGAGLSPYKEIIENLKIDYVSHDFNSYSPSRDDPGLQDAEWTYPKHSINCDILEIPEINKYDVVLCTEVLEHVPDPVKTFQKLSNLVNYQGFVLISVPFLSLMHQSPYWYSSGLSPFWFEYWANEYELEIVELTVSGDYIDLMKQEAGRLLDLKYFPRILRFILPKSIEIFRHLIPASVKESGGFNTLCLLKNNSRN
jgi:SAM-dependent methyltransferase